MTIFNSGHQQLGDLKGKRFVTVQSFLFWSICVADDTGSVRQRKMEQFMFFFISEILVSRQWMGWGCITAVFQQ